MKRVILTGVEDDADEGLAAHACSRAEEAKFFFWRLEGIRQGADEVFMACGNGAQMVWSSYPAYNSHMDTVFPLHCGVGWGHPDYHHTLPPPPHPR